MESGSVFTLAHNPQIGIAVVAWVAVFMVNILAPQLALAVLFNHQPSSSITSRAVLDLLWPTLVVLVFFLVVSHRFLPLFLLPQFEAS